VCLQLQELCVCFITAGPITKLCAWGRRRRVNLCENCRHFAQKKKLKAFKTLSSV